MDHKFTIEGMMCNHCTGRVKKALEAVEGVASVDVQLESGIAWVTGGDREVLKSAIEKAGYKVISAE